MKKTKKDYINYLVDVKGYREEEARDLITHYGSKCIDKEDLQEFEQFTS